MKLSACWCVLSAVAVMSASIPEVKKRYDGHQVIRFYPESLNEVTLLQDLYVGKSTETEKFGLGSLDFWSDPTKPGRPVDIRVSPEQKEKMAKMGNLVSIKHEVVIEDVQKLIDAETVAAPGSKLTWTEYHQTDDIMAWTEEIAEANSDFITIQEIGRSYEGREIRLVRINKPSSEPKIGVYIESQIHAREWITTATTTWIFNELLNNPEYSDILDQFDFHYVPVVNPDGVEYTWTNDRLWRKTRSDNGFGCYGADPNRNWDATFGGPGTSSDPCSDVYHGPYAFSESEVKAVSDYIMENKEGISLFVDVHSFSQFVLLPWGDTYDLPEDYDDLYEMGKVFEDNVKILYGTDYITGNIADTIYLAAGGSVDWVKATPKIKYSQALELRDTGDFGFVLPPEQIIPSGEETLMGLLAEMNAIRDSMLKEK